MKNSEILNSLIAYGKLDNTIRYDMKRIDESPINMKEWIVKYKRYNVNILIVSMIVVNLINSNNDRDKDFWKFERYIEFLYSIFRYRDAKYDKFLNDHMLRVSKNFNNMYNVLSYDIKHGNILNIQGKDYIVKIEDDHTNLYSKSGIRVYRHVIGIVKDIISDSVKLVEHGYNSYAMMSEDDKVKIII